MKLSLVNKQEKDSENQFLVLSAASCIQDYNKHKHRYGRKY